MITKWKILNQIGFFRIQGKNIFHNGCFCLFVLVHSVSRIVIDAVETLDCQYIGLMTQLRLQVRKFVLQHLHAH